MSKHKGKKAPSAGNQKQSRSAQRKKKPGRINGKVLLLVAAVFALGIAGFYAMPYLSPAPSVVHPDEVTNLDPAVEALIAPMLAAAEANPRDAVAHATLAMAYEANGLWKEAQQSYTNAVQLDDSQVNWYLHLAMTARQNGDFETALKTLRTQAPRFSSNAPFQNHYAEALLEAGELDEAEKAFRHLISISGQVAQGYAGLGDILLQKGAGEEALQVLEEAVRLNPDYTQVYYLLGSAYTMVGRPYEAEIMRKEGIGAVIEYLPDALGPSIAGYTVNATGRIGQATAFLGRGEAQTAAKLLEGIYQFHNTNVMLLNTLASAYLQTNRLDDALRILTRARELDPDQFFTYLNLYTWALRSGNAEQALTFANESVVHGPERDDTHLAKAQALAELGRFEEGLIAAQKAVELGENKANNQGMLGDIYFRLKRYEDAEKHLGRALELNGQLLPALVSQAQTKWALGKYPAARNLLNTAKILAPSHPRVQAVVREFDARK